MGSGTSLLGKENTPSPRNEIPMEDSGLEHFGSEFTKNTSPKLKFLMKDRGMWRLIAVFPAETVSFLSRFFSFWFPWASMENHKW